MGDWSILASHAQLSFGVNGQIHDLNVVRLPVALPNKQATSMWPPFCAGDGGLWPGLSNLRAKVRAVLTTRDAAPSNVKLLGHLQAVLDPTSLLLPLLCLQHCAGNVVQRATKLLGILPGSFAVSKTLRSGFVVRKLTGQVRSVMSRTFQIFDQVPPGLHDKFEESEACARAIFKLVNKGAWMLCHVLFVVLENTLRK